MKRTPAVAAMLTLLLSAVCGAEPELCFSFEDEALPGVAGKAADAAGQVRELVPEKAGFPGGKDFSVSCFIRPSAKPGYQIVLSQAGMNPADRLWWIGYSPSLRRFDFLVRDADGKGQSQVFSRSVDSSSEWIHVAAACRDGKLAIRATGLEKAQLDTGSSAVENRGVRRGAMPLLLGGRRGEQPRGCFDGAVDELTLWSRGLLRPRTRCALPARQVREDVFGKGVRCFAGAVGVQTGRTGTPGIRRFSGETALGEAGNHSGRGVLSLPGTACQWRFYGGTCADHERPRIVPLALRARRGRLPLRRREEAAGQCRKSRRCRLPQPPARPSV